VVAGFVEGSAAEKRAKVGAPAHVPALPLLPPAENGSPLLPCMQHMR
jgi:hypothetical protein